TPAAAPKRAAGPAAVPAKTAPPPAAAPTGPRTVVVEIIQGVKRSSAAYEDPSPESNGNSTQTDGTTQ
ncbi:MAG TPA: hypothetical protein VLL97_03985, partial [Acidobacteriota bacterium]|nr:hypothetical protein [Acidobacteriota bacterium]